MIRLLGWSSICASIFVIGYRVGIEVAIYQGSAQALIEAARLRINHYIGIQQAYAITKQDL